MSTLELTKNNGVYVLTMTNGEKQNAINLDVLKEYIAIFDKLEATTENTALVWTSNNPKFWCTGADMNWLLSNKDKTEEMHDLGNRVYLRAALLNMPTIACITGHCYAAGTLFAAACDFRFMRKDKGRICMPEVDVNVPLTGCASKIFALLPNARARKEMLLTGKAYGGEEAAQLGIVDCSCKEHDLFPKAMEMAEKLALKGRDIYTSLKRCMREDLMVNYK